MFSVWIIISLLCISQFYFLVKEVTNFVWSYLIIYCRKILFLNSLLNDDIWILASNQIQVMNTYYLPNILLSSSSIYNILFPHCQPHYRAITPLPTILHRNIQTTWQQFLIVSLHHIIFNKLHLNISLHLFSL